MPIDGVCLYPIIDRPDWENPMHWHKSGLWDVEHTHASSPPNLSTPSLSTNTPKPNSISLDNYKRVLNEPYAKSLREWQIKLASRSTLSFLSPELSTFKLSTSEFSTSEFSTTESSISDSISKKLINGVLPMQTLLVFSHLRWNFVYQRPQHLLSRLANHYHIIFVEEPLNGAHDDYLERLTPCANVDVLRPHLTSHANGFEDEHAQKVRSLLDDFLSQQRVKDFWLWFYTPLALPITHGLNAKGIIYDCMDELAAFKMHRLCY